MLSNQDSNLDWLIQSQMCYHYTIGQALVSFEIGCKSTTFLQTDQIFFILYPLHLYLIIIIQHLASKNILSLTHHIGCIFTKIHL